MSLNYLLKRESNKVVREALLLQLYTCQLCPYKRLSIIIWVRLSVLHMYMYICI